MLTRKGLECALVISCLLAIGCGDVDDQSQPGSAESKQTASSRKANAEVKQIKESLGSASKAVSLALTALSGSSTTPDGPQPKPSRKPLPPKTGLGSDASNRELETARFAWCDK